jgi:hypothetical protein
MSITNFERKAIRVRDELSFPQPGLSAQEAEAALPHTPQS